MQSLQRLLCAAVACGLLTTAMAAPASAQNWLAEQELCRVVVLDSDEYLLDDATVLFRLRENAGFESAVALDGQHYLPAAGRKALLWVESPVFGSHTVELMLPGSEHEVIVLQASRDGVKARVELPQHFGFGRRGEASGNTPPPPPGQGCQLPNLANAYFSDLGTPYAQFECFKPERDGYLTHLVFWGAYSDGGGPCEPNVPDDFTVTYYEDDGGCAGNVLAGPFSVGLTQKFATGNLIIGLFPEYQYQTAFHQPVQVSAGQCVWVEIINNTANDPECSWGWETSSDGDGMHCLNQTDPVESDLAFCTNILIQPGGCADQPMNNDECDECLPISGDGTFDFDNTNATSNGPDHPECDKFGTQAIDNDVWFCWTAPCNGDVALSTCGLTAVDTKVAVYDGTNCNDLTNSILDCNDDTCGLQSVVNWTAVAGDTYLVRIGTFPGASGGTGQFDIQCRPALGNDDCAGAIPMSIGETVSGDTTGSTLDAVDFCGTSVTTPGIWYTVVGDGNTLTASTCDQADYDTKISVYCGGCDDLVCVTGNDDGAGCSGFTSETSWCSQFGETYYILVHGFGGQTGTFDLTVSTDSTPCASGAGCVIPFTTDVDSNLDGVFIRVLPLDLDGQAAGLTPFRRTYNPMTPVEIQAPMSWEGKELIGWRVGDRVIRPREGRLSGYLQRSLEVEALYASGETTQNAAMGR